MPLKQNNLFVFFLTIFIFGIVSFFTLSHVTANVITVNDPTGDDIDNGLCSIVEAAINAANDGTVGSIDCIAGSGEEDVISIETDIILDTVYTLDGSSDPYAVPNPGDIVINGNNHTIERDFDAPEFRIFSFSGGYDVEINDLTIRGGDTRTTAGQGGAMRTVSLSSLILNNVTFDNNAAVKGGAVFIEYGLAPIVIEINDSTFSNNISSSDGGAIYFENNIALNGVVIIDNSIFDSNFSSGDGGALHIGGVADVQVRDSYFTGNATAGGSAGGVFYLNESTVLSVLDSYFYFNRPSTTRGGVFYSTESASIEVGNSTFENNVAGSGGVFYLHNGVPLAVYNSSFLTSVAIDVGGVIFSYQDSGATPNEIEFYHNTEESSFAGEDGSSVMLNCIHDGAFCMSDGGPGNETPFVGDFAYFENNIFLTDGCTGNMQNVSFLNNLGEGAALACSETGLNTPATNITNTLEERGGIWKTFPLLSGSNALDTAVSGTLGCPSTDARGVARPFAGACDIGAYEYTGDVEVVISETGGTTIVIEPSTDDTYTVVLGEGPSSSVAVDLAKSDNDFNVSPSSITFTTLNWFTPRTITVSPVNNSDDDGDRARTITHTVDTVDANYSLFSPLVVNVTLVDEDEAVPDDGDDDDGGSSSSGSGPRVPPPTPGCMDNAALNYNPSATTSNGSCTYNPVEFLGCDDINARNYDIRVTENDGSCVYPVVLVPGCMDNAALNYNSSATTSNGSCTYNPVPISGCMDNLATNFNSSATVSDNSCSYPVPVIEEPPLEEVPPEFPQDVAPPIIYPEITTPAEYIKDVLYRLLQDASGLLGSILGIVSEEKLRYATFAGIALPALIFITTQPATLVSIPVRLWSVIPSLLGMRRKRRPWGTAYDSVTKQPLDPVYLVLKNESGQEVATTISDIDGRFSFIVAPGRYMIQATKDSYEFPSKKLFGKSKDELYENLYFNELIDIRNEDDLLIKNIPMDPLHFNWNEFEKSRNKRLMKFFSKTDLFLSAISNFVFTVGVIISLVLVFASPSIVNFLILGFYYVVIFLRLLGIGPKKPGHVIDSATKSPLSFGIVKLFSTSLQKEIGHSVIGKTGRYHILVPNGEYFVQISKKTGEDMYEQVFTSESFKIRNGYLGEVFKV